MDKMFDKSSSLGEVVDGFVSYKINKYKSWMDNTVKKFRGELACESDIIMADLLEP